MNIIESKIHHILAAQPSKTPNLPKLPSGDIAKAIQVISGTTPAEFEFDRTGHVRHFAATSKSLFSTPYTGDPRTHAAAFLATSDVHTAFDLDNVQLSDGVVDETGQRQPCRLHADDHAQGRHFDARPRRLSQRAHEQGRRHLQRHVDAQGLQSAQGAG
jgi:hypothetical protein